MKFEKGDPVLVWLRNGDIIKGTVHSASFSYQQYSGNLNGYWVTTDGVTAWYSEEVVFRDTERVSQVRCDCGAVKTYAPNPPPGHAWYCNVESYKKRGMS